MILFNASDIIEIEFAIIPITSFTIESKILTTIPVALESIPYFPLVFKLPTSLSFMNNFINKFVKETQVYIETDKLTEVLEIIEHFCTGHFNN